MKVREFLDRYVFVKKCVGCGEILDYEHHRDAFCAKCRMAWEQAKVEGCPHCLKIAEDCRCMPDALAKSKALCLRKLFFYRAKRSDMPQNRLIYFLKNNRNRRINAFLAEELRASVWEELSACREAQKNDEILLTCVPRGKDSKRKQGHDQAEELARTLAERMMLPYAPILRRRPRGNVQKSLNKAQRLENAKRSFVLDPSVEIKEKCVVLLDDVVTSGASMAACVSLLKKSGARSVICVGIAQD